MSIEWFLYLVSVLGNIGSFTCIVSIICGLSIASLGFISVMKWDTDSKHEFEEFKPKRNYLAKMIIVIFVITSIIGVFIPPTKTMYAMGFSHYAKQTQIPQKLMDLLNQKLDDALGGEKL